MSHFHIGYHCVAHDGEPVDHDGCGGHRCDCPCHQHFTNRERALLREMFEKYEAQK